VLVLIGVRKWVMDAVPDSLARAISVGIGLFILFIGLRNAGLILFLPGQTGSVDGFLALAPLNTWPIAVAILGLVVTPVLMARGFRPAILSASLSRRWRP
jgi:AGZA family xanthine/uracil permease-like MFS transporter